MLISKGLPQVVWHGLVDTRPSLWLLMPSRYAEQPSRGKPLLISILACSLGFYAVTLECSTFTKFAKLVLKWLVSLFGRFVARGGRKRGNRQTDRPSTVTLAVHARRGLIIIRWYLMWRNNHQYTVIFVFQSTTDPQPSRFPTAEAKVGCTSFHDGQFLISWPYFYRKIINTPTFPCKFLLQQCLADCRNMRTSDFDNGKADCKQ